MSFGVWTRRGAGAVVAIASLAAASTAVAAPAVTLVRTAPLIAQSSPLDPFGSLVNDTVTSTNWAGYAVASTSKFTDVKGSWVEPTVNCAVVLPRYAAYWAGIDGYTSDSVEQLGTDSDCTGYGKPSYYAWYEMYPAGSVDLSTTTYPVKPGDTLSAEVSTNGTSYTLTLHSSEGWTFSTTKVSAGLSDSSAELIAESPEICGVYCRVASLPNFGTVSFSDVQAATGGADANFDTFTASAGPHDVIGETALGAQRMLPSAPLAPSASGDAFTITWKHA